MVKRIKQEDMAGALEFPGVGKDDPLFQRWMDEHRSRNGGKIRVGLGSTGVRVMFSRQADMTYWQQNYQNAKTAGHKAA